MNCWHLGKITYRQIKEFCNLSHSKNLGGTIRSKFYTPGMGRVGCEVSGTLPTFLWPKQSKNVYSFKNNITCKQSCVWSQTWVTILKKKLNNCLDLPNLCMFFQKNFLLISILGRIFYPMIFCKNWPKINKKCPTIGLCYIGFSCTTSIKVILTVLAVFKVTFLAFQSKILM